MRLVVMSDIHGQRHALDKMFRKINFDRDKDKLVLLGDYVDRGDYSFIVVDDVMGLSKKEHIILKGNHEQMLCHWWNEFRPKFKRVEDWIFRKASLTYGSNCAQMNKMIREEKNEFKLASTTNLDIACGRAKTISDAIDSGVSYMDKVITFLNGLPSICIIDDFCFVHGGINPLAKLEDQKEDDLVWSRTLIQDQVDYSQIYNKTFVYGHTATKFNDYKIYKNKNGYAIDCGAGFGKNLGCLIITDNGEIEEHYINTKTLC